jgi:hypothetical protein
MEWQGLLDAGREFVFHVDGDSDVAVTAKQATWQLHKPHKITQLIKKHMRKTTKAHGYHMYSQ